MACLNCRGEYGKKVYARGLCGPCWHEEAVKERFPLTPQALRSNERGYGLGDKEPKLAKQPTAHPPGSEGKVEVMRQRAAAGEHIWHPRDAGSNLT